MENHFIVYFPFPALKRNITGSKQPEQSLVLDDNELDFIYPFISIYSKVEILKTKSSIDIAKLDDGTTLIINLQKINDIRYLNKYFKAVNAKVESGGILIGCAETYEERQRRIRGKYSWWKAEMVYYASFIFNRVLPKLNLTKRFYFYFTKGNNRVISKAETLGRLISCGFEILGTKEINNLFYFAVKKIKEPCCDQHPSYGLFIQMKRIGKGGKIMEVFKIRTMHPYAEYLQEYIYRKNNIDVGGKFKDDFRIAKWGCILRKLWIDELPMLINYLKGDVKIVGVRPLSVQYLNLYPQAHKLRRMNYKPGLIPPYYIDLPKTIDEIVESEKKYLDLYDKHHFLTDIKYFILVFYSIIFRHVRSR